MAEAGDDDAKKSHRPRQAGKKREKKKKKNNNPEEEGKGKNPRAFAIQSVNKAARQVRRGEDLEAKKHHIPLVDRKPDEPPPVVVCVVGPPKVGKSTLIQNLIKNYTREKISELKGPVTVVSGKKQRLTFIECPNDINYMIDIAKVADLVLLLIDASFGFEMEIFEFLNVAQVHGFPKIIGVLTHLDLLKKNKSMQKIKKTLKQRFWTEVYQGAKLFYLSNINHGLYPKTEVANLARFVQVMKFRPLAWRSSHPYMVVDRFEDITDPAIIDANSKCDRSVRLYGYMRGAHMKFNSKIHVVGCGDYPVKSMHLLADPCPLPDKEKKRSLSEKEKLVFAPMSGVGGIIYDTDAVYIDLGGSKAGRAAAAANRDGNVAGVDNEEEECNDPLVSSLHTVSATLDDKMEASGLNIFKKSKPVTAESVQYDSKWTKSEDITRRKAVFPGDTNSDHDDNDDSQGFNNSRKDSNEDADGVDDDDDDDDDDDNDDDNDDDDDDNDDEEEEEDDSDAEDGSENGDEASNSISESQDLTNKKKPRLEDNGAQFEDDEDSESDLEGDSSSRYDIEKWKDKFKSKIAGMSKSRKSSDMRSIVYGNSMDCVEANGDDNEDDDDDDDLVGGMFALKKKSVTKENSTWLFHKEDSSMGEYVEFTEDDVEDMIQSIKDCFTKKISSKGSGGIGDDDEGDLFGDFVDLENMDGDIKMDDEDGLSDDDYNDADMDADDDDDNDDDEGENIGATNEEKEKNKEDKRAAKKRKIKEMFNQGYDETKSGNTYYEDLKNAVNAQAEANKQEFKNLEDDIRVQYEGFRAGLYVHLEVENVPCEFVTNFDPTFPVIVGGLLPGEDNIGYIQTRFKKHRWYGKILKNRDPLILSVGWRRFQTMPLYSMQDHNGRYRALKYTPEHLHCIATMYGPIVPPNSGVLAIQHNSLEKFKIAATGVVLDLDKSVEVVKKLKLVGTPLKVFKNTAFIKGMFTSTLEVTKFEGASIRTVSGIRGEIKKAIKAPPGAFRASFEDKILTSDIVFCRTWYPVACPQFYNPVQSLLLRKGEKHNWVGMKTVGQLRKLNSIKLTQKTDSLYKPIERSARKFNGPKVPKKLQADLPFKSKQKNMVKPNRPSYEQRRAVVVEGEEKRAMKLMKGIFALNKENTKKLKEKRRIQHEKFVKKMSELDAKRDERVKEQRKRIHKILGQEEKRKQKKMARKTR